MKKELLISFLSYGVSSALSKFIGVLLLPIYTRYYSSADYGVIDMIQTIVLIVMVFGSLQLETSLQRFYYEVDEYTRRVMASTVLIFTTLLSLILMVLMQLFAVKISTICFHTGDYAISIIIASTIILLTNISVVSFIIIRFMKKPLLFAGMTLLQVCVTALSTLLFIYSNQGILAVFYGQVLGYLVLIIFQLIYLRKFYIPVFDKGQLKILLDFALPQFPARLGSIASSYANRFIMLGMLSLSAIGLYSVALKCASAISILQAAFVMSWIPFFYEQLKNPNHKQIFRNMFKYVCYGLGVVVIFITLFSKEILELIASPEYLSAYTLVGGLSLYLSLFIIKEYIDIGPRVTKRTSFISYTFILTAILNFLLLYFFTPRIGLDGVVWSMIGTNIFLVISSWFISEKLYHIGFSKINFVFYLLITLSFIFIKI